MILIYLKGGIVDEVVDTSANSRKPKATPVAVFDFDTEDLDDADIVKLSRGREGYVYGGLTQTTPASSMHLSDAGIVEAQRRMANAPDAAAQRCRKLRSRYRYKTCCVESTAELIDAMTDTAIEVSYFAFRRQCEGLKEWAKGQGYFVGNERGLHLHDDYHVSYYRSTFAGKPCYYLKHSAIEYIWTKE